MKLGRTRPCKSCPALRRRGRGRRHAAGSDQTSGLDRRMPVGEVAHATGFAQHSHFSRAFRQRFGVSPGQVRNGAR